MHEDSWEQAWEFLSDDPDNVWSPLVLALATRLAERAEDPSRIWTVKRRLEVAYLAHQLGDTYNRFVERLEQLDLDAAELLLDGLGQHVLGERIGTSGDVVAARCRARHFSKRNRRLT